MNRADEGPPARRILLVEDDPDACAAVERLLRAWGYDVSVAENVASALGAAQETHFDLLISDIRLPDGTGTHLLRKLLGTTQPHIKAIAVSELSMEDEVDAGTRAGFDHHIAKPINFPELGDLIPKMFD